MNFYKHHLGDYDGATAHLSWEEDLAYRRLLSVYYRRELPLPKQPSETFRLVRATTRIQKEAVSRVLEEFFHEQEDGWHQKRADEEIKAYQEQCQKNREVGKLGGRPKKTVGVSVENHEGYESVSRNNPNQEPRTKNQEPEKKQGAFALPDWVPEEPWKAWLEVRSKNRAPNTPRALAIAVRELDRLRVAGQDPVALLEKATLSGWRSIWPLKDQPAAPVKVDR